MNCIPYTRGLLIIAFLAVTGCNAPATESVSAGDPLAYSVAYTIAISQSSDEVEVSMHVRQNRALLREVRFARTPSMTKIQADDGNVEIEEQVIWQPAASGGTLRWTSRVANLRGAEHFDALLTEDWGIFRAEDVIPRAATRVLKGAHSKTSLRFSLPTNWSVITAYAADDDAFPIVNGERSFVQPSGWIATGRLGIRRETIAGMRVAVAAPIGHAVRRMDTLALLNWTLPELSRVLGSLPPRLTIVSAADPMWRGGLSGPNSMYVHADRPLISENSTSTLLHEVIHSVLRQSATTGYDWIVEGLAEFYSIELLRRSGTISESRYRTAIEDQRDWARSAGDLCRRHSKAATTALAVTVLRDLDVELRELSAGKASLDDVLKALQDGPGKISLARLQTITTELAGKKATVLQVDKLPGCRSIQSDLTES